MYTQFFFVLIQFLGSVTSRPNVVGQGYRPAAFQGPSTPRNVNTFFTLTAGINRRKGDLPGIAPANPLQKGHDWYTELEVEGQTYPVVIDTGSSDTWIVKSNFTCLDYGTGVPTSQSVCLFGPGYAPSSGFNHIPNQHFNTTYASGENLKGTFGLVDVTLGGISVNAQIATVDTAAWLGDGTTSGLLGLAYPSITAAFNGTTFGNDNAETQLPYDPIFTTMYQKHLIPPIFSLALSRPSNCIGHGNGYLALGGLPPIASYGAWAVAPIQIVAIGEGYIQGALPWPQHQVYTLTPDNFIYPGSQRQKWSPKHWSPLSMPSSSSQVQLFIDSGTTLIFLPNSISSALAALYNPPAVYNADLFAYSVPCNAKVPYFAVVIGGVSFPVDPRDMVQDDNTGMGNCVAGVSDGDLFDFYTLGDVFLKNVVVVFDVGASQLKFRSRGFY
ncbi:putative pepsin (secreted protein) protein [Botrytis fragariae]|uniref:Putative pepsin (Secreted protein) protein n=1 Tax=Botrytis fragariae TaxID=1964551 RepID=A0A8H6B4M5_9HELO|nr:putative pepsin (secreted protein) protein [Botrytis fragariae]KAF5879339.1 putative pepsin (secreted protein) protein [Botrytis fragariae]